MLFKRYIRFYDGINNAESIIWWAGATDQKHMWQALNASSNALFETARSAGNAYYCGKKKELITNDYCSALNLIGRPEDGPLLSPKLFDNKTLKALYAVQKTKIDQKYDLILASDIYAEAIKQAFLKTRHVADIGITYRIHDSNAPFIAKPFQNKASRWIEYAIAEMGQ